MAALKCIIILSEKSSGSSVLQTLLSSLPRVNLISKTRHFENETLYWTKAASILGLPQIDMANSDVPIDPERAKKDLTELMEDNIDDYDGRSMDRESCILDGWRRLCQEYRPILLEKSPHHLCQWSAIELIMKCMQSNSDIDFLLVGLVRNPLDTMYSQFVRWRTRPEDLETQWCTAYHNLTRLRRQMREMVIIRYEDMVSDIECLKPILNFCGAELSDIEQGAMHAGAVGKWKKDGMFGFVLSEEANELARSYGYSEDELDNSRRVLWPICREVLCRARELRSGVGRARRKARLAVRAALS